MKGVENKQKDRYLKKVFLNLFLLLLTETVFADAAQLKKCDGQPDEAACKNRVKAIEECQSTHQDNPQQKKACIDEVVRPKQADGDNPSGTPSSNKSDEEIVDSIEKFLNKFKSSDSDKNQYEENSGAHSINGGNTKLNNCIDEVYPPEGIAKIMNKDPESWQASYRKRLRDNTSILLKRIKGRKEEKKEAFTLEDAEKDEFLKKGKKYFKEVSKCFALSLIVHGGDEPVNFRNSAPQKNQKGCFKPSLMTRDFTGCNNTQGMDTRTAQGVQAGELGASIFIQSQNDKARKNFSSNEFSSTAKLQQKSIKDQEKARTVRGTTLGVRSAALKTASNKMPDLDDVRSQCASSNQGEPRGKLAALLKDFQEFKVIFGKGDDDAPNPADLQSDICDSAVAENKDSIIANSDVKQAANDASIQAGILAAAEIAKALILRMQAKKLGATIKKADAFKPVDWNFQNEALVSVCEVDPKDSRCPGFNFKQERGFSDFGNLNIGTLGSAKTGIGSIDGTDSDLDNSSSSRGNTGNGLIPDNEIGSAITGVDKNNDFHSPSPGPAQVKKGAHPGGGGGGGGSAGGGGGGGGGAPQAGGGGGGDQVASGDSAGIKYGKGSGRSLNFSHSGRRGAKRKVASNNNPFKKLLGRKNGTLNFKVSSIGNKGTGLFQMISNGYEKASKKNKLLRYKTKN